MSKKSILFVVPVIAFAAVLLYLIFWNAFFSFTDWSILHRTPKFVGVLTYGIVLSSSYFKNSLIHSFVISGSLVLAGNIIGLLLAGLLFSIKNARVRITYMSIFIYPLTISMAANALIFLWLFNPNIGINWLLGILHLPQPAWLVAGNTLYSVILIVIWAYSGIAMLFYLAAFMNIDKSIIEAAYMDGAHYFRIFRKLLIPNAMNGFIVSTALLFLFSFRIFSLPYVISGGPSDIYTQTMLMYQYFLFVTSYFAESSVIDTIVVIVALAIVIPYALIGMRRWIHN
jgi:glucose/arabinose transport system permease protein